MQTDDATFSRKLLKYIRYPSLESSHQALLAAALGTRLELIQRLDGDVCKFGEWAEPTRLRVAAAREIEVEHTPPGQRGASRRCRFDILVPLDGATVIIECKWRAATDLIQLARYARLLSERAAEYPNPMLVLISVDGAPPADAQALYQTLKVPLRFASWEVVGKIISHAVGDSNPEFTAAIEKTREGLQCFADLLCGQGAVPRRDDGVTDAGGEEEDDDEDVRPVGADAEGTRAAFDDPTIPERFALSRLAGEVITALDASGIAGWQVSMPPTLGPRRDVQCDLTPSQETVIEVAAPPELAQSLKALDCHRGWLIRLGSLKAPLQGDEAATRVFQAIGAAACPSEVRPSEVALHLRLVLRLYFSQSGEFRIVFGANLRPYLNGLLSLPEEKTAFRRLHDGELGEYVQRSFSHGPRAKALHEILLAWSSRVVGHSGWCHARRGPQSMWTAYARKLDVAVAGSKPRAERIVEAIRALLVPPGAVLGPLAMPREVRGAGALDKVREGVAAFVRDNQGVDDWAPIQVGGLEDRGRDGRASPTDGVIPRRWQRLPRRHQQKGTDHYWTGLPLACWFQAKEDRVWLHLELGPSDEPATREGLRDALVSRGFHVGRTGGTYSRIAKSSREHHGDLPGTMNALWQDAEPTLRRVDAALREAGLLPAQ